MSDLLSIGSSALLAYRRALDVTSHNIANVDTEGYSRQRVDFTQRAGMSLQVIRYGDGVGIGAVQRMTDRFLFERIAADDISLGRLSTMATMTSEVDGWLSGESTGISSSLQGFFDGLTALSADPSSSSARTALLDSAHSLTARFSELQNRFDSMDREIDGRTSDMATQVNEAASRIAALNDEISKATLGGTQQPPNDLLDQRETALRDLAKLVGYTTTKTESDGSVNVFIGGGQPLVLGNQAGSLEVGDDEYGRPRELRIRTGSSLGPALGNRISGGELGGMLDFRREVLEPSINELGRIATTVAQAINEQHAQGIDLYGELGGDFFTLADPEAIASTSNAGTAAVDTVVGDATALTGDDYALEFTGGSWVLTNTSTGANVPTTGTGAPGDPIVADGLEFTISGVPADGDSYLIQPTRHASGTIDVAITDPARIAAAGPLTSMANVANAGDGTITAPTITDVNDPALMTPLDIQFVDATNYTINGAGPFAYTPGTPIAINGMEFTIDGAPVAGDQFTVSPTGPDSGDNTNANALAAISDLKLLDDGRTTLAGANSTLVSGVGSKAVQFETQAEATAAMQAQTIGQLDSIAGVNLDEEAADMTRYEQAYSAAAQIISTAQSLFDTLIAAVRR